MAWFGLSGMVPNGLVQCGMVWREKGAITNNSLLLFYVSSIIRIREGISEADPILVVDKRKDCDTEV